ncbi:hypothetical protein MGN70_002469 [Eutypa lata]|nr:hypothetical protein MGN70_002469 [Eutypa lata]
MVLTSHTDLVRMKQARVGGQFCSRSRSDDLTHSVRDTPRADRRDEAGKYATSLSHTTATTQTWTAGGADEGLTPFGVAAAREMNRLEHDGGPGARIGRHDTRFPNAQTWRPSLVIVYSHVAERAGQSVVADYPELVEAVLRRGAADGQVRKLVGENISQGAGIPFFAK